MNRLISVLALAACMTTFSARAANTETSPAPTQQNKMKACNKEAVGKKGDERRAFMSQCLKGPAGKADTAAVSSAKAESADRTKACKAEAKGLKGAARKDAVAACLAKSV